MKIEKDRVVRFHYTVSEKGGEPVESSKERGEPLAILIGHGNIIPGLEKAMEGHAAGDSFTAEVGAADAYGERQDGLVQRVPKKHFGGQKLAVGQQVVLKTSFGPRAVTVEKVGMSVVDVDLNHPMAGKELHFDVEIVEVREAQQAEIDHGHVHGDGGHDHGDGGHGDDHAQDVPGADTSAANAGADAEAGADADADATGADRAS